MNQSHGLNILFRFSFILALVFSLSLPTAAWADAKPGDNPLAATLDVVAVEVVNGKETTVPAGKTAPGRVLQYTGHYKNLSTSPLAGIVVNGQIPAHTTFIETGLSADLTASFEVLIEGEAWQALPAFKTITGTDGVKKRVPAVASDYQQLRWKLAEPLAAGGEFTTTYRVRVDQ